MSGESTEGSSKLTVRPVSFETGTLLGLGYYVLFFFKLLYCYQNGVLLAASILESSTAFCPQKCIHFPEVLLASTEGYPLINSLLLNVAHISYSIV